jgi:hypothetical protein
MPKKRMKLSTGLLLYLCFFLGVYLLIEKDRRDTLDKCSHLINNEQVYKTCINPPVDYDPTTDQKQAGDLW